MPVYHHESRIVGKIVDETFPKHRNHQDMKRYTVGVEWHVEVAGADLVDQNDFD